MSMLHARPLLLAALLGSTLNAVAAPARPTGAPARPAPTTAELLKAASPSEWVRPDPDHLLYMELDAGRVIIELAPAFAPRHVANIQALARGHFWDGLSIYRSQDNFVVQFGDPDADTPAKAKPFPQGVAAHLPAEFDRPARGLAFTRLPDRDGFAPEVGFSGVFPTARDPKRGRAWLAHCYGTLGAGRGNAPDSSTGAELYVVTGQAPRQLDLNITTVGRVLAGMQYLSVVPRGDDPMGMITDVSKHVRIRSIRLASEVPPQERTELEVLRSDSPTFNRVLESRRNRRDSWYVHPAGHIDVCGVNPYVRTLPPTLK